MKAFEFDHSIERAAPIIDAATPSISPTGYSTKLYPPRLRQNFVVRHRVISTLGADQEHRVTIVSAPAGYGKSTVVAQWAAQLSIPAAWVTLEPNDDNLLSFFGIIVSGLRSIDQEIASVTERMLATSAELGSESEIDRHFISDLSAATRPFLLVIDDFEVIRSQDVLSAVNRMLLHLPLSMRLVLISRAQPELNLARLRASGDLLEVGREDLQFGNDEALRFFQEGLGLDLTLSEIQLLQERTEGWAAGLHLAGVALRGQSRDRIERFFDDLLSNTQIGNNYLWEEVLQRQSPEVHAFLLRASILDRFTADLCDAVIGSNDGRKMVQFCDRSGLFLIPLDDGCVWYRFHQLFADVLRERLSASLSDDELCELHSRAATWLLGNEFREDAIRHLIAGRFWDRAVPLLEDLCALLFELDDIESLRSWLDGLPTSILDQSAVLSFYRSWALGRTGRWSDAVRSFRIAEESWTSSDEPYEQGLLMMWHAARSLHGTDNQRSIDFANRALELLPGTRPFHQVMALMTRGMAYLREGEPITSAQTFAEVRRIFDQTGIANLDGFEMTYSSHALAQQGMLQEAAVLCRRVSRDAGLLPLNYWVQAALALLGEIYYEWGLMGDAQRCLQRASDIAENSGALQWRPRIAIGLAQLAWARGDPEESFDLVERAVGLANRRSSIQHVRNIRARQARLWLASNQHVLARRWADSSELEPFLPSSYEHQVELLTYARLLIMEQRPDLALKILQRILASVLSSGRHGERIEILTLIASAQRASGDTAEALLTLQQALQLGEPRGYLRTFADEGSQLAGLLRHAATHGNHRDYAQRILNEIEGGTNLGPIPQSNSVDALSEREIEVLRLVAAGLPNRDIGQRLFISEKTVKKHLSNILGKFQATNRTQAVDQGRRRGLL